LSDGTSIIAEKVLCALGRPPNFAPLQLENCGVLVEKNAIKVDEYSNTNI
jgi:pyruvate/2-oxoglutarate dehydrogenase complex dihydrolipoamide dehydrogenase (E3) component